MLSFVSEAQTNPSSFNQTASNPTGAILNTSIDTMTYTLRKSYPLVSIQPVITRATGTMAGNAILYKSVNGTNWVATGDTLTFTNAATNTTVWTKTDASRYWKVVQAGATTVTGTAACKISASE